MFIHEGKFLRHSLALARTALFVGTVALTAAGCSAASDDGDGDSSSTVTISGNLTVGSLSDGRIQMNRASRDLALFSGARTSLPGSPRSPLEATQCDDGNYYQVYCVSFSDDPVANQGDVDCSADGAFSVSDMPTDVAIGCFVRSSADGTNYSTVGTIELPASDSITGTSGSMVLSGNMQFNVTIGSDGTITASVVSDGRSSSAIASSFDTSTLNGTFKLTCDDSAAAADYDECDLGSPDGFNIDFGVYTATFESALDDSAHGGPVFAAGDQVKVITGWDVGGRGTGGEGFNTMDGKLSWSEAQATEAVEWGSGSVNLPFNPFSGSGSLSLTIPSIPDAAHELNWSSWMTFAQDVVEQFESQLGIRCPGGDGNPDPTFCIIMTVNSILREMANASNLPMVSVAVPPGFAEAADDDAKMNSIQLFVGGLDPNYTDDSAWSATTDYTAHAFRPQGPFGAAPSKRHVVSPLELNGDTATFRFGEMHDEWFRCYGPTDDTSGDHGRLVVAQGCDGTQSVQCRIRAEMRMDLHEQSATVLQGVLTQTSSLVGSQAVGPTIESIDSMAACQSAEQNLGGKQMLVDFTAQ